MSYNILTTMKIKISINDDIKAILNEYLKNIKKIYSYVIYNIEKDELIGWLIKINISEKDEFNTLYVINIINNIYNIITNNNLKKSIIGYEQPSLEIMLEAYEPFFKKLVDKQVKKWKNIEYDDAYQICMLTVLKLYRKKYYLHKTLLINSYNNEVLLTLRKRKNEPCTVSFDDVIITDEKPIRLVDVIEDTNYNEEQKDIEHKEYIKKVFYDMKDILIDYMGERQFEQFYKEYANKRTTDWSRRKLTRVKNYLNKIGINKSSFDKYL